MFSWISRHPIQHILHLITFAVHDIMIPSFLVTTLWLVYTQGKSYWHRTLGKLVILVMCPILFLSGLVLSYFTPFGYLFRSYGISFLTLALDTYIGLHPLIFCLHYVSIISIGISIGSSVTGCQKLKEISWAMSPLLYFHCRLVSDNLFARRHKMASYVLTYSGWMGTIFSITQDNYWLFSHVLPIWIKMVLQQIPLIILLMTINNNGTVADNQGQVYQAFSQG